MRSASRICARTVPATSSTAAANGSCCAGENPWRAADRDVGGPAQRDHRQVRRCTRQVSDLARWRTGRRRSARPRPTAPSPHRAPGTPRRCGSPSRSATAARCASDSAERTSTSPASTYRRRGRIPCSTSITLSAVAPVDSSSSTSTTVPAASSALVRRSQQVPGGVRMRLGRTLPRPASLPTPPGGVQVARAHWSATRWPSAVAVSANPHGEDVVVRSALRSPVQVLQQGPGIGRRTRPRRAAADHAAGAVRPVGSQRAGDQRAEQPADAGGDPWIDRDVLAQHRGHQQLGAPRVAPQREPTRSSSLSPTGDPSSTRAMP